MRYLETSAPVPEVPEFGFKERELASGYYYRKPVVARGDGFAASLLGVAVVSVFFTVG